MHWLQDYLNEYEGVLIVISHDRHFLNSVCTHTADIDYQTVIMYNGGYDDMVMAKTSIRSRIESENAQREKKIAQLKDFIARFSAGTRSAQATSRKKEVERLQTTELAQIEHCASVYSFQGGPAFRPASAGHQEHREIVRRREGVGAVFGGGGSRRKNRVDGPQRNRQNHAAEFPACATRRDLLTTLTAQFPVDGGQVIWGHNVAVGYFAQDHSESITHGMNAIEWLHQFKPQATQEELRGVLGQMLFSGEEAHQADRRR